MKKKVKHTGSSWGAWDWTGYGLAAVLFLAGQFYFLNSRLALAAYLSAFAFGVTFLRLVMPRLPWHEVKKLPVSLRGLSTRKAASKIALQVNPWSRFVLRFFPDDCFELNRLWLLLPAVFFIALLQISLLHESVTKALLFLGLAVILVSVYLQDVSRPLRLTRVSSNLGTLWRLVLAVPVEMTGVWMLWNYQHVWIGYFLTVLATLWMIWTLRHKPFLLADVDEADDASSIAPLSLDYKVDSPWFNFRRLGQKIGLLAAAGICGFVSLVFLSSAHAALQVSLAFFGIFLFVGSFPWFPHGFSQSLSLPKQARPWIALGAVLLAFYLGLNGQNAMESGLKSRALWLFFAGAATLIAGLSRFSSLDGFEPPAPRWALRTEMLALGLLLFVAFQFRIWNLNWFPYGAEGDEAGGGMWAMDALRGTVEHPLIHQNYPLHFFSVTALFFKLAGVSVATMRWHSVVFGTLSVAAVYFFIRLFVGRFSAWLVTALMAFSFWHLHYSRFGHYNIEQVFCQMVAYYFVFKGMKTGRFYHFVVGGVAFALAMFPHMAGRLLPFQGMLFLAYLFVGRRDLLRRHFTGFAAFVLGAWLIASPAVTYWLRATSVSMGRIQSVSIFDKNNSNAPVDVLAGFVQNCKVSMLMFNDYSDSRTRDNPLAPERILEHWTAILFALSFLYVLYHWRDPVHFFLLGAFFVNLSASVFSVEAPQTLRTAGNIPLVFFFIAVVLGHFHAALVDFGWKRGTALFLLLVAPALSYFGYRSAHKLFVDAKRLSFDVEPTYIAQVAGQRGKPEDQAAFFATGFASSHPPVILFAGKTPIRNFYYMNEYLPIGAPSSKNHLLFLGDDYARLLPYLQSLYPDAKPERIEDQRGGEDIAVFMELPKAQLQAIQGLNVEVVEAGGKKLFLSGQSLEHPLAALKGGARALHYSGSLKVDLYGAYLFTAGGKGDCTVRIDGKVAFQRLASRVHSTELRLPIGLNTIEVDFRPASSADPLFLDFYAKPLDFRHAFCVKSPFGQRVVKTSLFMKKPQGLHATYYATADLSGPPVYEAIEPAVLAHWLDSPLGGNWSIRWRGKLHIPKGGNYSFSMIGPGTELRVDGILSWSGGKPIKLSQHPEIPKGPLYLTQGVHELNALFSSSGPPGMEINWSGPGGQKELLPASVLEPIF